jgi:PAS domain S-box-containing protein
MTERKRSAGRDGAASPSFKSLSIDLGTIRALQVSTNRYRTLFDNAGDAIFVSDLEGRMVDVNRVACEKLGYTRGQLMQMDLFKLTESESADLLTDELENLKQIGQSLFETTFKRFNGEDIPIEASCRVIDFDDNPAVLTIARDISERKEAEQEKSSLQSQLRQSQKMEAIGTLAGGIAHDFNNILAGIMGYAEIARIRVGKGHEAQESLEHVLQAAERAKFLVRQILSFSRSNTHEDRPIQLGPIVKETLKLLRASLPSTIEIREEIDPECGIVRADATQIHQVIMNLCTNAAHAMRSSGGRLIVKLSNVSLSETLTNRHELIRGGKYLKLSVSDTGHGIRSDIQDAIFDPYFTTKNKGEGTGLGLSVVQGIIKNHKGVVTLESEPGKGATFEILLPLIKTDEEISQEKPIPVFELLKELGYQPTTCMNPIEALALFRAHPRAYDLIITDMTMPKMTGDLLAVEIRKIRPDIPMILCTGFSEQMNEDRALALGFNAFLLKPFSINELATEIQRTLKARRPEL